MVSILEKIHTCISWGCLRLSPPPHCLPLTSMHFHCFLEMSLFWNSQCLSFCRIYNLHSKRASTDVTCIAPHLRFGIFSKKNILPLFEEIWGLVLTGSPVFNDWVQNDHLIYLGSFSSKLYLKSCISANTRWISLQNGTDRVCYTFSLLCSLFLVWLGKKSSSEDLSSRCNSQQISWH